MESKVLVSVIILNYNTFSITCQCISSIIEKTKEVDYEIILVDNASSECDAEEFRKLFPSITLIKSPVNLGFAKGNNLGIEQAKGNYLLLLNSDVEITEDSISKCYTFLSGDTKAGALSPRLVYPDGTMQFVAETFPGIKYELLRMFRWHLFITKKKAGKLFLSYFYDYKQNIKVDMVWASFFMMKREILDKLPGGKLFDKHFMYAEELFWCHDIKKLGYDVWFFAGTTVIHYHSFSFKAKKKNVSMAKLELGIRNRHEFMFLTKGKAYTYLFYFVEILNALTRFDMVKIRLLFKQIFSRGNNTLRSTQ